MLAVEKGDSLAEVQVGPEAACCSWEMNIYLTQVPREAFCTLKNTKKNY